MTLLYALLAAIVTLAGVLAFMIGFHRLAHWIAVEHRWIVLKRYVGRVLILLAVAILTAVYMEAFS